VRKRIKAAVRRSKSISAPNGPTTAAKIPHIEDVRKDGRLEVSDLFSFFTANIIKEKTLFTR
jgi:hypothetical protein